MYAAYKTDTRSKAIVRMDVAYFLKDATGAPMPLCKAIAHAITDSTEGSINTYGHTIEWTPSARVTLKQTHTITVSVNE